MYSHRPLNIHVHRHLLKHRNCHDSVSCSSCVFCFVLQLRPHVSRDAFQILPYVFPSQCFSIPSLLTSPVPDPLVSASVYCLCSPSCLPLRLSVFTCVANLCCNPVFPAVSFSSVCLFLPLPCFLFLVFFFKFVLCFCLHFVEAFLLLLCLFVSVLVCGENWRSISASKWQCGWGYRWKMY